MSFCQREYYVDAEKGNDSPTYGSKTNPWKTLKYAINLSKEYTWETAKEAYYEKEVLHWSTLEVEIAFRIKHKTVKDTTKENSIAG